MTGLDLSTLSCEFCPLYHVQCHHCHACLTQAPADDVSRLRDAVWRHKVVIVKNNGHIEPKHQEYLMKSLDPETTYEAKGQNDINDRRNGLLTASNIHNY